ncbi:hypothetical protein GSI_01686 [Ganoderma sinense ZZ0214-1]|uniref:Uncharacterized protein n=1 Tax=Ganoderma sinense ZZ0214-1 TaxID=1077348 RepID=A0A2G8SQI1_9APHY|nr:hypothetical protein GSI_01686 [Ganoderma sinense ZZ0214-1]
MFHIVIPVYPTAAVASVLDVRLVEGTEILEQGGVEAGYSFQACPMTSTRDTESEETWTPCVAPTNVLPRGRLQHRREISYKYALGLLAAQFPFALPRLGSQQQTSDDFHLASYGRRIYDEGDFTGARRPPYQHQAETLRMDTSHQSELERKDVHYQTELERKEKEHQAYVEKMEQECAELKSSVRLNRYVWDSFSRQNKEFESMLYPFLDPETRRIKFPLVTFPSCACGAQPSLPHLLLLLPSSLVGRLSCILTPRAVDITRTTHLVPLHTSVTARSARYAYSLSPYADMHSDKNIPSHPHVVRSFSTSLMPSVAVTTSNRHRGQISGLAGSYHALATERPDLTTQFSVYERTSLRLGAPLPRGDGAHSGAFWCAPTAFTHNLDASMRGHYFGPLFLGSILHGYSLCARKYRVTEATCSSSVFNDNVVYADRLHVVLLPCPMEFPEWHQYSQVSSRRTTSGPSSASTSGASSGILSSASGTSSLNVAGPSDDQHYAIAAVPNQLPVVPAAEASVAVQGPRAAIDAPVVAEFHDPAQAPIVPEGGFVQGGVYGRFALVASLFGTLTRCIVEALAVVVYLLKFPFILFLVVYLSLLFLGYVVDTASESLAPVCNLFPRISICRVTAVADGLSATFGNIGRKATTDAHYVDFPGLMALQSRTLDQLLAHSTAGSQLALNVKHAELAVKDLGIIVKASNLTSKDTLTHALEEFAQDAKDAGRDLQQLSAKLYGIVDTVLAFDDYALRSMTSAQASGVDAAETAASMFRSTMTVLASEVAQVILHATAVASTLDTLDEKLAVIRSLSVQEMVLTQTALGSVLSDLWTILGGNKDKVHRLAHQVEILGNVDWYRMLAVSHVTATTETLLSIEAELSELRNKLSAPELTGNAIPIEVHITSIERSVRRIKEEKLKTRDLGRHGKDRPNAIPLSQSLLGDV